MNALLASLAHLSPVDGSGMNLLRGLASVVLFRWLGNRVPRPA